MNKQLIPHSVQLFNDLVSVTSESLNDTRCGFDSQMFAGSENICFSSLGVLLLSDNIGNPSLGSKLSV